MNKILLIVILFTVTLVNPKQLHFNYASEQQTVQLYKYLSPVQNGFYVDIGAYHPITLSNTLNLYTNGWHGINVQANPKSFKKFLQVRGGDVNVWVAIGDQNQFVTFYQHQKGIYSTLSKEVSNDVQEQYGSKDTQLRVPALKMGDLCNRYYTERPQFLNMNIPGSQYEALTSNNWTNKLCRPHIIFLKLTQDDDNDNDTGNNAYLPQTLLKQNNYTLINNDVMETKQIYIDNQFTQKYQKSKLATTNLLKLNDVKFISTSVLENQLCTILNVKSVFQGQYDPTIAEVYLHFAVVGQIVDSKLLRKKSVQLISKKPTKSQRPILILQFDPIRSTLAIDSSNYSIQTIAIGNNQNQLFKITITPPGLTGIRTYQIYILNQKYIKIDDLQIFINDFSKSVIQNHTKAVIKMGPLQSLIYQKLQYIQYFVIASIVILGALLIKLIIDHFRRAQQQTSRNYINQRHQLGNQESEMEV